MSKLLARAKVKLANAQNNYKYIGQDDAFLDETCYNLQQCIEMSLKYLVEMQGENYVENHDVRAQINKLKSIGAEIPCEEEIRGIASTLNDWEAQSRYNDNFTALIEDVDIATDIANKLVAYCDELVKEAPTEADTQNK